MEAQTPPEPTGSPAEEGAGQPQASAEQPNAQPKACNPECSIHGAEIMQKVKAIIHEANSRRLHVSHGESTIVDLPLTVVAVGVLIAPVAAALGTLGALVSECTITVEHHE